MTVTITQTEFVVEPTQDDSVDCISCDCSPKVTLCGRFDDGPRNEAEIRREKACPDCYAVCMDRCPRCGCANGQTCHLCEVPE